MATPLASNDRPAFELRYPSLFQEGRAFAFPCDAEGHVDIDRLSGRLRLNYLFARGMVGRDFACPIVQRVLQ